MSLVNEHERRALASVGNTHAASLLAQLTQAPGPGHQNGSAEAPVGQQIHRDAEDASVLSFSLREISQEQSLHLRTKQISKPGDKGLSQTVRPLAVVKDFLSYVLKKGESGLVRVIHCPTVCKALVTHQTAVVADHCMKISTARTDNIPSVLLASIDRSGLCCVSLFCTPGEGALPSDPLPPVGTCRIRVCSSPDAGAPSASALVDVTNNKAVIVFGKKLFELDVDTCLQPNSDEAPLDCGATLPPGVRELYSSLPPATFVALNPQASEVAVGCSDGTVQVLGTQDLYPVTSFNTCELASQGPVLHVGFLQPSHPHSVLASATELANGTLVIGIWKVDRTATNPVHQVVPVDTLELSGDDTVAAAAAAPRRWCVRLHPAMGVVLAAQTGGRDIMCFGLSARHRFSYRSRFTVGAPVLSFAVDESSCAATPNGSSSGTGGGQILVRCPEGIMLAAIDCEQLRPPYDPGQEAEACQSAPPTSGPAATADTTAALATPVAPADARASAPDTGAVEDAEEEGGRLSQDSSLTSMLLEAARASAGGGGMGLPSLASLSTPPEASRQQSAGAAPGVAPAVHEPVLGPAAHPAESEDAAGVAAAVAQAAIENVLDGSAEGSGAQAVDRAGPAPVTDSRVANGEALLSTLLGGRPSGGAAAGSPGAGRGEAVPGLSHNGGTPQLMHVSTRRAPAEEGTAVAGMNQENALVEMLLNKNLGAVSAVASGAATPHAGGTHADDAASSSAAVPLARDATPQHVGTAAAAPASDPGRAGDADGAVAAMRSVEASMRDCFLLCKGVQSTASRLQRDVGQLHSEVAKGVKAQAVMEKAVRRAEAGMDKIPDAVAAAVAGGLEVHLKQAVAEKLGEAVAHGFRSAFADVLVPAFENAMQTMFAQANDALNKGLAQHLSAAEVSLAATTTRLEAELQAAVLSMETANHATLAAATAATQAAAVAAAAAPPAPPAPAAPKATPAYSGTGGGVSEYAGFGGQIRYSNSGGGAVPGPAAPVPASVPARRTPRSYAEQPSMQHAHAQSATVAGYGVAPPTGPPAPSVRVPPAWQYLAPTVTTAPTPSAPSAPDAPPGFTATKDADPSAPPPQECAPDSHAQALPPSHAGASQQPQPRGNGGLREAPAEPPYLAAAVAHPPHAAHAAQQAVHGYHAPRPLPQPVRRDRPEGVPVYEHISRIVAALEQQDAAALADVCLQTPVALVQEMSQLHAAVIMNMLCPLVSRGHTNIVGLFGWLWRCAERVAPKTIEQPKQVKLVFQKVLEAVDARLAVEEVPQTIAAGIGVRKVLSERLPQFPV